MDVNRHVNNLAYLRWMQDVAIAHSTAQGWPMARYLAQRQSWVVRSHFIEYLLPAVAGEELLILTWVADMRTQSSRRRYLFWRPGTASAVARAETQWVYVDMDRGRPLAVPDDLRQAFDLVPDTENVLVTLGLAAASPKDPA